ncbi:GA module protein [Metamycoplasma subdolum]|uniref:GA module protein n=2 Tax=Metamycoplasma subdolum TaxID=92407 RepID=A0A3L9ZXV4_9BACT|nr:GA module-containing protein [Metamycoplasma subdolum]RMA77543.1 GA module protein [Metamycoplasma subdolum]WPB50735.1 GA module-containing protein [Metamycoplasma subdolum]
MSKPKFKKLLVLLSLLPVSALPLTSISLKTDKQNNNKITETRATRAEPWHAGALAVLQKDFQEGLKFFSKETQEEWREKTPTAIGWEHVFEFYWLIKSAVISEWPDDSSIDDIPGAANFVLKDKDAYAFNLLDNLSKETGFDGYKTSYFKKLVKLEIQDHPFYLEDRFFKENYGRHEEDIYEKLHWMFSAVTPYLYTIERVSKQFKLYHRLRTDRNSSYEFMGATYERQQNISLIVNNTTDDRFLYPSPDDGIKFSATVDKLDEYYNKLSPHLYLPTAKEDLFSIQEFVEEVNRTHIIDLNPELQNSYDNIRMFNSENDFPKMVQLRKDACDFGIKYATNILNETIVPLEGYYLGSAIKNFFLLELQEEIISMVDQDPNRSWDRLYTKDSVILPLNQLIDLLKEFKTFNKKFKDLKTELNLKANYYNGTAFTDSQVYKNAPINLQNAYNTAWLNATKDYDNFMEEEQINNALTALKKAREDIEANSVPLDKEYLKNFVISIEKPEAKWLLSSGPLAQQLKTEIDNATDLEKLNLVFAKIQKSFADLFTTGAFDSNSLWRHEHYNLITNDRKNKINTTAQSFLNLIKLDIHSSDWKTTLETFRPKVLELQEIIDLCAKIGEMNQTYHTTAQHTLNIKYSNINHAQNYRQKIEEAYASTSIDKAELSEQIKQITIASNLVDGYKNIWKKFYDLINGLNVQWLDSNKKTEIINTTITNSATNWDSIRWNDISIYEKIQNLYTSVSNSLTTFISTSSLCSDLNHNQRAKLLSLVPAFIPNKVDENATHITTLNNLSLEAIQTSEQMKLLKEEQAKRANIITTDNYKHADKDKKDAYDQAFANSNFTDAKTKAEVESLKTSLEQAREALNGDANLLEAAKAALIKEIQDDEYLETNQKQTLIAEVNLATQLSDLDPIREEIDNYHKAKLEQLKNDLKAKINATDWPTSSDKTFLLSKADNMTLKTSVQTYAEVTYELKNLLKNEVKSLENLNKAQKDKQALAIDAIKSIDKLILEHKQINELEKVMKELIDIQNEYKDVKTLVIYLEEKQDKKDAFDNAYNALTFSDAKDKTQVEALIKNVKDAKEALKGDSILDQAKKDLKTEIDNNAKLNKEQKDNFKNKVDQAKSSADLAKIRQEILDLETLLARPKISASLRNSAKAGLALNILLLLGLAAVATILLTVFKKIRRY